MARYLLNLSSHLLITTSLCRDTFGSFDFLIDKLQIGKLEKDDNITLIKIATAPKPSKKLAQASSRTEHLV